MEKKVEDRTEEETAHFTWFVKNREFCRRKSVRRWTAMVIGNVSLRDKTGNSTILMLSCSVSDWLTHLVNTWNEHYDKNKYEDFETLIRTEKDNVAIDELFPCSKADLTPIGILTLWFCLNFQAIVALYNNGKGNKQDFKAKLQLQKRVEKIYHDDKKLSLLVVTCVLKTNAYMINTLNEPVTISDEEWITWYK